jgi:hypothetical protein
MNIAHEKAKLNGHARGLVFLKVTTKMLKAIWPIQPAGGPALAQYNNGTLPFVMPAAPAGSPVKVQNFYSQCRKVASILTDICAIGANGWCTPSIDPLWKRRYLKGVFGRTYELTLAFSTFFPGPVVAGPNVLIRPIQHFHCVGIASNDTADPGHRTFQNAVREGINANKELLILDIVCAKNGAPGVASTLLNYVITEQFKRVSRGQPKYKAAYIYPVHSGLPPIAANAPLLGVVGRLGFVTAPLVAPVPQDEYNPRILLRTSPAFELQLNNILEQHLPAGIGMNGTHQPCPVGKANGMRKCV